MTAMRLKRYPSPSGGIALGKMGVGATLLKQGKTARDYVQDGLVAMWDVIENAGWGQHDDSATTCVDLTGNCGILSLGSDGMITLDTYKNISLPADTIPLNGFTLKNIVRKRDSTVPANRAIFANLVSSSAEGTGISWLYPTAPYRMRVYFQDSARNTATYKTMEDLITLHSEVVVSDSTPKMVAYFNENEAGSRTTSAKSLYMNMLRLNPNERISAASANITIYNRALTADEIARNYAIDKERFNLP